MKRLILVGILALILLAGCISTPSQPGQPAGGGNQAATTGTAGTGAPQTAETGGQPPATTEGGAGEVISEEIGNLGEALSQSVPMECTAITTSQGTTVTTHYWVKSGNMRAESQMAGQTSIVVVKGDKFYMDASVMQLPEGVECDWIVFEEQETEGEPSTYSETVESYANPADVQAECHPAVFGDEKFATPGTTCTMEDLVPPMPEMPSGYEACEGLTDQALIDCIMQQEG